MTTPWNNDATDQDYLIAAAELNDQDARRMNQDKRLVDALTQLSLEAIHYRDARKGRRFLMDAINEVVKILDDNCPFPRSAK
jgi:hypothetical protein